MNDSLYEDLPAGSSQFSLTRPTIVYGRQNRAVQGHLFGGPAGYQAVVWHRHGDSSVSNDVRFSVGMPRVMLTLLSRSMRT